MDKRPFTDAELLDLYRQKIPIAVIAEAAGLSFTWTLRRIKRAGVVKPRAPRPCPVPVGQLAAEYAEGLSILTLAERHGLYYKRVRTLLLEHGVTLRPSTKAGG